VQFGEGGAGLFSDGKLYSQIKDPRHLGRQVMSEFVRAGAPRSFHAPCTSVAADVSIDASHRRARTLNAHRA
jgi:hypothetical protein